MITILVNFTSGILHNSSGFYFFIHVFPIQNLHTVQCIFKMKLKYSELEVLWTPEKKTTNFTSGLPNTFFPG